MDLLTFGTPKWLFRAIFIIPSLLITLSLPCQINTAPSWAQKLELNNISSVNKNEIKDGYYYLLVDEQYNSDLKHNYFHYAYSAINDEALTNISQIEFSYDPSYQQGNFHSIIVHRDGVKIDKTKEIVIKELVEEKERSSGILSGKKTLYTNLSDIRKGDIIEYSYSILGDNPIMKNYFNMDFYLSYTVPVGRIFIRLLLPKNIKPNFVFKNNNKQPIIKYNDKSEYIWDISNPKISTLETTLPDWFSVGESVQISNLQTWNEVKKHCADLFSLPEHNNRVLKSITDSIIKSQIEIEDQISAVIEFVQSKIRYSGNENGIYSHIPRTPDLVFKNRYGDCKEKSVLLNSLLKNLNIKAFPVLINTYLGEKVTERVPSINSFNHVISAFYFDNQLFFVDPTISYQRGNFRLRTIPSYEIGMILDNEINPFTKIPINLSSFNNIKEEFYIEKSGDTRLKVKCVYTGSAADERRYTFLTNSINDIQKSFKEFYTRYSKEIYILDTLTYEDRTETNEFVIYEDYMLPHFWTPDNADSSKIVKKEFAPYSLNLRLNYGEEDKRNYPLSLSYPLNYMQTISITKEGGWDFKNEIKKENNKFFNYSFETKVDGEIIRLIYNYSNKTNVIPAEDYQAFKSKMDFINYNIVFNTQQTPLVDGTIGFNWGLFLALLIGTASGIFLIYFLHKKNYQNSFINKFDSLGGWLIIVVLGVVFTPITLIIGIISEYSTEFNVNYITFFFNEESSFFSPIKGYYLLTLPVFNIIILSFSIYLIVLLFQRNTKFRPYFCMFRVSYCVFMIINLIVLYFLYSDSNNLEERTLLSKETTSMVRAIIGTLIWVPYVWNSERSKHTFTNGNLNNEPDKKNESYDYSGGNKFNETSL